MRELTTKKTINPWEILSVTTVGSFMSTLNSSTIRVAVPTLAEKLHASIADVGWVVTSFMISLTISAIYTGKISDLFGRNTVYMAGVAVFTLSSTLAGFSPSVGWLIAARVLQGIGGAAMMSNAIAMVTDVFPPDQRGKGLGLNGSAYSAGALLGPVVGGFLLGAGWRWIFWFNVPIGIILLLWTWRILPSYPSKPAVQQKGDFDVFGAVYLLIGLVGLLGVITYGTNGQLDILFAVVLLAMAVSGSIGFIWAESRAKDPIVQISLFRNRTYALANWGTFVSSITRMTVTFVVILYLQVVRQYSALDAGLAIIPLAALTVVIGPFSGRLADRIGPRLPASIGLFITSIAVLGLALLGTETSSLYLTADLIVMGFGTALFQTPNSMSIMNSGPAANRSVVAGTRMMLNNLGMMLAVSISVGALGKAVSNSESYQKITDSQQASFLAVTELLFLSLAVINLITGVLYGTRNNATRMETGE